MERRRQPHHQPPIPSRAPHLMTSSPTHTYIPPPPRCHPAAPQCARIKQHPCALHPQKQPHTQESPSPTSSQRTHTPSLPTARLLSRSPTYSQRASPPSPILNNVHPTNGTLHPHKKPQTREEEREITHQHITHFTQHPHSKPQAREGRVGGKSNTTHNTHVSSFTHPLYY